ncbi:divergent PAP2 family protein [Aminicella lysinilytica]|uniref:Divergent PAP2 family protein n=1 Tax=Aminicella lysinilytica TaxID=433323 RepID=A0A4R6QAW6_9FIRM|nr:divergent PAP2 family protein [Aminicella lysinilytica]NLD10834.1 divergent PAP2 family protein [Clostridiales bacterium]TDP59778.1 hypothetical protein EV211_10217 [Aminicella lysinilytica]
MGILIDLITNKIFVSAAAAWFAAQLAKNVVDQFRGRFARDSIFASGGMPSAHTATVVSLAASTGIVCGLGGFEFAMAVFFAIVVIYDSVGVRYETGQAAKALNKIRKIEIDRGEEPLYEKPMLERTGHTIPEVIAGGMVGIICAVGVCALLP